jgi:excisionase family DNA binding protein
MHSRTAAEIPEPDQDRGYSMEDAARLMGIGRSTVYELLASGRLESIKIGRRRIIPGLAIRAFMVAELEASRVQRISAGVI